MSITQESPERRGCRPLSSFKESVKRHYITQFTDTVYDFQNCFDFEQLKADDHKTLFSYETGNLGNITPQQPYKKVELEAEKHPDGDYLIRRKSYQAMYIGDIGDPDRDINYFTDVTEITLDCALVIVKGIKSGSGHIKGNVLGPNPFLSIEEDNIRPVGFLRYLEILRIATKDFKRYKKDESKKTQQVAAGTS